MNQVPEDNHDNDMTWTMSDMGVLVSVHPHDVLPLPVPVVFPALEDEEEEGLAA